MDKKKKITLEYDELVAMLKPVERSMDATNYFVLWNKLYALLPNDTVLPFELPWWAKRPLKVVKNLKDVQFDDYISIDPEIIKVNQKAKKKTIQDIFYKSDY